jgi:hypothetical protein
MFYDATFLLLCCQFLLLGIFLAQMWYSATGVRPQGFRHAMNFCKILYIHMLC